MAGFLMVGKGQECCFDGHGEMIDIKDSFLYMCVYESFSKTDREQVPSLSWSSVVPSRIVADSDDGTSNSSNSCTCRSEFLQDGPCY